MMSLKSIQILQIIISVLLMLAILLQGRGAGLGGVFGGSGAVYRTKRGAEKTLFWASIILAACFIGLGIVSVILYQ
ncbi:MAG: preprotein translocase subunit SecG [bacterium]